MKMRRSIKFLIFGLLLKISIILFVLLKIYKVYYFLFEEEVGRDLELDIPMFALRQTTYYDTNDYIETEKLKKIKLTKSQNQKILEQIKNNNNWQYGEVDKKVVDAIKFHTNGLYEKIPEIEKKYWIISNRTHRKLYDHDIDRILEKFTFGFSIGIFDYENRVLYYFAYVDN